MIAREVIAPRLSRLAIVGLIALVATVGAVASASLVAGERESSVAVNGPEALSVFHAAMSPETTHAFHATPSTLTTIQLAIITADTTYEIGVTLPSGERHDVMVCPGGNPWPAIEMRTCTAYDFTETVTP